MTAFKLWFLNSLSDERSGRTELQCKRKEGCGGIKGGGAYTYIAFWSGEAFQHKVVVWREFAADKRSVSIKRAAAEVRPGERSYERTSPNGSVLHDLAVEDPAGHRVRSKELTCEKTPRIAWYERGFNKPNHLRLLKTTVPLEGASPNQNYNNGL